MAWPRTRASELLGIECPVIQGAMAWLSNPALVAAVSNAGGLGVLATASMTVEQLEEQVDQSFGLTKRNFAVNFPLALGEFTEHLDMCIQKGVRTFVTSAGSPSVLARPILGSDAVWLHVVPDLRLAKKAIEHGVHGLILEANEAGGHIAPDGPSMLTSLPRVSAECAVPIIAAGGFATGSGIAAAFCLGADAVQMGTRFLATEECRAPDIYKQGIVAAKEGDIAVFGPRDHPGRALVTPVVKELRDMASAGASDADLKRVMGQGRAKKASEGEWTQGIFYAGGSAALISDVPTVADLFCRLELEYQAFEARLG